MLIHLVLKDFLIVKKYVLLVLLVAVAVPPFLLWRNPELASVLGLVFSIVFGVLMPLMYLGEKENKYANATLLLAATPYPRKWMVVSKYLVSLLMFCVCTLIFWLETLIFPSLGGFNAELAAVLFFHRQPLSQSLPAALLQSRPRQHKICVRRRHHGRSHSHRRPRRDA